MQQQYPYANTAQGLASLGRGEDTMLMHITPEEFEDFNEMAQAAGFEHIPINPYTGLPEYGFGKAFKSVRKAVSKVVKAVTSSPIATTLLSAVVAPAFGISPLMMGLGIGGLTAATTGDIGKGFMAGLSAYGGANLGSGIGALGKNVASYESGLATGGGWNPATQSMAVGPATTVASSYAPAGLTEHLGNMASGVESLFTSPISASYENLKTALGTIVPGTEATPETVTGITRDATGNIIQTTSAPAIASTPASVTPGTGMDVAQVFGGPALQAGLALAGPSLAEPEELSQEEIDRLQGTNYDPDRTFTIPESTRLALRDNPDVLPIPVQQGPAASYYTPEELEELYSVSQGITYAKQGGLMHLASGKYLQGRGDGMSDSIKANIDGEQEARLSAGEFVLPADVVSHLGNGSSEAGASKLYKMMNRLRKDRTGTTKQGREIDPYNYMPA